MELKKESTGDFTRQSNDENHLSNFCRASGTRFFIIRNSFWMSRGMRFFSPWPASKPIVLSAEDLEFIWSQKALFIHYVSTDDKPFFPGYDFLVNDKNYGLDNIQSSKRRHNIRWALKRCSVERVSFDILIREAGPLIEDTHLRQKRVFNNSVLEMWRNYFRLAESNPLFEAWASFVSGQLAAVCVVMIVGDGAYIEMTFSRTELLRYHPVDALAFVVTQRSILLGGVSFVSYGKRPIIGEADGLANFKETMGFKKILVKERVEAHPFLRPIMRAPLNSMTYFIANKASGCSMYARIISGVLATYKGQIQSQELR
jgi:hypothetical protein